MARTTPRPKFGSLSLRLASATGGLPLLGLVVWAGGPWIAAGAALAAAVAVYELLGLLRRAGWEPLRAEGAGWAAAIVAVTAYEASLLPLALTGGAAVLFLAALVKLRSLIAVGAWTFTVAGTASMALPMATVVVLRAGEAGLQWLLVAFLGTFATDTGAYAVGKLVGRHRIAPRISPGKTWEGAVGGLLVGVGVTAGFLALLGLAPASLGAGLGLAVVVVAQAGDLLESKLKRLAGVKESGSLIPGHGGLLDRLDSLVLVFPLIYYASQVWPA